MLRNVAFGRDEARGRLRLGRECGRVGASGTELGRRGKLAAAVHARQCQRRRALLAEPGAVLVLVLAPCTLHHELCPPSGSSRRLAWPAAATATADRQSA